MLLTNLREPYWYPFSCNIKLLKFIVCETRRYNDNYGNKEESIFLPQSFCKQPSLQISSKCYLFVWHHLNKSHLMCQVNTGCIMSLNQITLIYPILQAISTVDIVPTFIMKDNGYMYEIKLEKHYDKLKIKQKQPITSYTKGIAIYQHSTSLFNPGINIFFCTNGGYISFKYVCDSKVDCPNDRTDEDFCECFTQADFERKMKNSCKSFFLHIGLKKCHYNYYLDVKSICKKIHK